MERAIFDATVEDLERVTTPLTDEQRDVYYEHLKKWPAGYLERAVKTLIQTYRAKRFPSIPIMRRVLDHIEIKDQTPATLASPYDALPCPACNNLGWWGEYKLDDGWGAQHGLPQTLHFVIAYCQCDHGRRRKEAVETYFRIMQRVSEKQKERREEPADYGYEDEKEKQ